MTNYEILKKQFTSQSNNDNLHLKEKNMNYFDYLEELLNLDALDLSDNPNTEEEKEEEVISVSWDDLMNYLSAITAEE